MNRATPRAGGFTLVELLVVVAIVGMLLAILMPTIAKARRAAQASTCLSNLRGWAQAVATYTTEHRGRYWIDYGNYPPPGSGQGTWMRTLAAYYRNLDRFRLCPSADQPTGTWGSPTFGAWGPIGSPGSLLDPNDYGSYGVNCWMNDLPATGPFVLGWRLRPDLQWRRVGGHRGKPSEAPIIGDCEWYGGNPMDYASGLTYGRPAIVENALYRQTYGWPNMWYYDMARFAMNRHGRGIQMAFEDGSARYVEKTELWRLHWYRGFRPANVNLPY